MRWYRKVIGLTIFIVLVVTPPLLGQELQAIGQIHSAGTVTGEGSKKMDARLRGLITDFQALGITGEPATVPEVAGSFSSEMLKVDNAARAQVYVYVTDTTEQTLGVLRRHGLDIEIVNQAFAIAQGWIPVENLEALASESVVVKIRLPSYGTHNVGNATTQGDAIHRCDQARVLGLTGAGVKVGVVSDGVSSLAASQASGDLPAVQVLSAGSGDEGTAILQIIYDCAPGAALAFSSTLNSSGFPTSLAFIQAVNDLRAAGAQIIVDDFSFFTEPYFEDGLTALNDRAVGSSVLRVSAAGNGALAHYQGTFAPGVFDSEVSGTRHDFGGGKTLMRFHSPASPAGARAALILQWANPFGSASDDYDLCVRQTNGTLLVCSRFRQTGNDDPIEAVPLTCTGPSGAVCSADLQITLFSGSPRLLELYCNGPCIFDEFNVRADSVFGHAAVPEVLAVAASPASNPFVIEPFSAAGPRTIFFPVPEVRFKPDLTGTDGVTTTLPPFNPFFGTSAAAPHVAAVAALVMEANPSYQFGLPGLLREALKATAVDLGAPGPDFDFGFGRADALNAVHSELNKARCNVRSDRSTVRVGEQFTFTVETVPGTGDPWDVYFIAIVFSPVPFTFYSVNLAAVTGGPPNVLQPSRPTGPITSSSQSFMVTAPFEAMISLFCVLIDPGFTRISPFSAVSISFIP